MEVTRQPYACRAPDVSGGTLRDWTLPDLRDGRSRPEGSDGPR